MSRKKTALKREAQFSRTVQDILRTVYPKFATLSVQRAVRDVRTKELCIVLTHDHHVKRLTEDRAMLKALFRREGVDVRRVRVELD